MSDSTPRLPNRPSLAQLRKRAKELLQKLHNGDPSAIDRLRKYTVSKVGPGSFSTFRLLNPPNSNSIVISQ
jgi:hypothetical protein